MQKILIVTNEKETLARLYDGDKVIKTASTKCSSTDTFSFAMGAKIAFGRLMDKPSEPIKPAVDYSTWRVVKRDPVVGDKVRIVNAHDTFGDYKNGDVLTVVRLNRPGQPIGIIKCDVPLMGVVNPDEYEILEPAHAFKVGDKVRIKHTKDCPNAIRCQMWDNYAGREATIMWLDHNTCHLSGIDQPWFFWTFDALEPCPERMVRVFSRSAYNAFIDAIDQHEVIDGRIGGKPCNPDWTSLVPESEVRK